MLRSRIVESNRLPYLLKFYAYAQGPFTKKFGFGFEHLNIGLKGFLILSA